MEEQSTSLRERFAEAESKRKAVESSSDSRQVAFQSNLEAAIKGYEKCLEIAENVSLFSPNETIEDVSSGDIQYFLVRYHLAELLLRLTSNDRNLVLERARKQFEQFLKLLDLYDLLSRDDLKTIEKYHDNPKSFSVASQTDPALRRQTKISRFKEEKALKDQLEHLRRNPVALQNDDSVLRDLHLTHIKLCTHQTFQALESIALELQVRAMAPTAHPQDNLIPQDQRSRHANPLDTYSERLDAPLSSLLANGKGGPILNQDGRPMRPFTLLDNRQRLQDGVFRPDHNLPTMTIDEYLEEERRRGGIIEGGGPQSMVQPEPNEDDLEKADEETMKARTWDEFREDNPKGAGNTMNMG